MSEPSSTSQRGASMVPLAAAATIAVVVVGLVVLLGLGGSSTNSAGQSTIASGALACPHTYRPAGSGKAPWVPAKPRGLKSNTRMAPDLIPEHVVVCAYLGGGATSGRKLSGERELHGSLGAVVDTVTYLPRGRPTRPVCASYTAKSDGDDYLVGITYAGGTVWVSAPGQHCTGSANGTFTSSVNLRRYAAAAYTARAWVPDPTPNDPKTTTPCTATGDGRLGQDTTLVPATPTRVTACEGDTTATTTNVAALMRALNRLPTTATTDSCTGRPSQDYDLRFRYADGPDVLVGVSPGCSPAIDNRSLQAKDTTTVVPLIKKILGQ